MNTKLCVPDPELLIKSLSEQGYTLSTAIADLIDNSIYAGATRIEILIDSQSIPLRLFIADNGHGMDAEALINNMKFPSADLDAQRDNKDMGRFGLGLKTASFSQARKFTVISKKNDTPYKGCTWDVEYLKNSKGWELILNSHDEISHLLDEYTKVSSNFHEHSNEFQQNTLIVWENLYKLKSQLKKTEVNDELEELRSHLGLVFHRYIQSGQIQIRLNNTLVDGFEPFPQNIQGVQTVTETFWQTGDVFVKFQGIILPKRSAVEAKDTGSIWVAACRTLEELQGIYVYRNNRLINYGGWLRTIPKSVYLQFGRLRIDITNVNDSEFHLNVAKSSLKIPFGLKKAIKNMAEYVAAQAAKEYRERLASGVVRPASIAKGLSLITKETGASGPRLKINNDFELLCNLQNQLNPEQNELLRMLITLVEYKLNDIWKSDTNTLEVIESLSPDQKAKISRIKEYYEDAGYSWEEIRDFLLDSFERNNETKSFIHSLNNK